MRVVKFLQKLWLIILVTGLMSTSTYAQLSGVKTIDRSGSGANNYPSFSAAIRALNLQGVGPGGVTFNVTGDEFLEYPPILTATGTASAPIVFQKAGTGANPVIKPNMAGTKANVNGSMVLLDGIIRIAYGDYITFDGIDLKDSGQYDNDTARFEYGYFLLRTPTDAPRHITIKNSCVTMDPAAKNTIGIYQSTYNLTGGSTLATALSGTCDSNFYTGNTVSANTGIYVSGNQVIGYADGYAQIENNRVKLAGTFSSAVGICSYFQQFAQVRGNFVTSDSLKPTGSYQNVIGINVVSTSVLQGWAEVQQNRVSLNQAMTSGSTSMYSIDASNALSIKVYDNVATADLPNAGSTSVTGFTVNCSAQVAEIYKNRVDSIYLTGTEKVTGMSLTPMGNTLNVHHNIIRNINTNGSNTVCGMLLVGANVGQGLVYNNVISELYTQTNGTDGLRGMQVNGGSWKVYYNTVYLDAQSTSATFSPVALYVVSNSDLDLANNILVNNSTPGASGLAVAFKRSAVSFLRMTSSSDRNIYYAGTPGANNMIYTDGTFNLPTLQEYKQLLGGQYPREQFSATENVPFINTSTRPYNLNISASLPTQAESLGRPIAIVTDDINGNARSTGKPDVGAYEGAYNRAETTPPNIYMPVIYSSHTTSLTVPSVYISDLSGVDVSTANKPRFYFRKKSDSNTYAGNTSANNGWKYVTATNSTSPFSFTVDYGLLYGGVAAVGDTIEYFVVAQDSVAVPNVGYNKGTPASAPASVNLAAANFPLTGKLNYYVIKQGMAGVINVGAGQTYTTLTDTNGVFNAINKGMLSGDVVISVTSDLNEPGTVALNEFIAEDPAFGVRIEPSAAVKRTIKGKRAFEGLIRFNYADNVTIDGRFGGSGNYLEFRNDSTADYTAVIHLIGKSQVNYVVNGCSNFTLRNCDIIGGSRTKANVYGVYLGESDFGRSTGYGHNHINILENRVMRSAYALYFNGDGSSYIDSVTIAGNTIGADDSDYYNGCMGIYLWGVSNCAVQNNKIYNIYYDFYSWASVAGISATYNTNNILISGNRIFNLVSNSINLTTVNGIVLGGNASSSLNYTVYNNTIAKLKTRAQISVSSTSVGSSLVGIAIGASANCKLYYNTVSLSDTLNNTTVDSTYSAALGISGTKVPGLDIRNNIFANSQVHKNPKSKSLAVWVYDGTSLSQGIMDYNAYFVPGQSTSTTSYYVGCVGDNQYYSTREQWRQYTQQDENSQPGSNRVAVFANDTMLTIADNTVSAAESGGIAIPALGVPNRDINGNARPKGTGTAPDIGAFEFEGIHGDFKDPVIDSLKIDLAGSQCEPAARVISVYFTDPGGSGVDTAKIIYRINGVLQPAVLMTLSSGTKVNGVWKGSIPATPGRGQTVSYSIYARDTSANNMQKAISTYKDGYLTVDAGLPVTINENTSTRLIAVKNQSGTVTWTPGSFVGDTFVTPAIPVTTTFYANFTDGTCTVTDSVTVTAVPAVIPVAQFNISNKYVMALDPVTLTDASLNRPDYWQWVITPSTYKFINGTTGSSQNPQIALIKQGLYTIKLVASNAAGVDSIIKTDSIEVYKEYCQTDAKDGAFHDNISRVHLNTLFQQDSTAREAFDSYVDYTGDSTLTTTLSPGRSYTLYAVNGGRVGTMAAWIDFNSNGTFEDPGEKLGEEINIPLNDSVAFTFTLPAGFEQGYTRMRVRIVYGDGMFDLVSCATYLFEEMEDFRINLCGLHENPLPASAEVCDGETVIADALNAGSSYSWSNGSTSQSVALSQAGTYTVEISNDFCAISDTIEVIVKEAKVSLGNDTTLCAGESITLDAGEFDTYTWSTGSTDSAITVNTTGKYKVMVTNEFGCAGEDSIQVDIQPLPDAAFTYTANTGGKGGNITFNATAATGVSYSWKMSDGFVSTQKQPVHQFSSNGTFDVKLIVTSAAGCTDSTEQQVQVNNLSVADPALVNQRVEVYPSPFAGSTTLAYELNQTADIRIMVYDITGRMVEAVTSGKQTAGQHQFSIGANLTTGVYLVKMQVNQAVQTIRVVKQD